MNQRLEELSGQLPEKTAAFIKADHHVRYLTGFPSGDSYVLVTREKSYFLTDFRYIELAKQTVKGAECLLVTRLADTLSEMLSRHGVETVYLESTATLAFADRLRAALSAMAWDTSAWLDNQLSAMRTVKDADELKKIMQAQALTEEGFAHILPYIREGVTEREVALELEFYMRRRGAERVAFDFIVVSGANTSLPHGIPTDKPIRCGDFITMDFGAVVDGYCSDMTRTVALGAVSEEQRRVYDTVYAAQHAALAVLRAGLSCCEGDAAARDVIVAAGYGDCFGHATGHGVGVQIHEEPRLSAACKQPLSAGQVVTVEPGIYLEGRFGVRIEDMVVIEENGCRNLTNVPKELLCLGT